MCSKIHAIDEAIARSKKSDYSVYVVRSGNDYDWVDEPDFTGDEDDIEIEFYDGLIA